MSYSASDAFDQFANQCKFISLCDLHCVEDHETKDFNRKNSGPILDRMKNINYK